MSEIVFRPLVEADLPMLHRWLNEPGVVRWWEGEDVSWEAVVRDYGPGSTSGCGHHLALLEGREVGWIQACDMTVDDPDGDEHEARAWWDAGVPRTAAGIDYLVADPGERGQGLGTRMIRAFVEQVVFADGSPFTHAVASPYVANEASWRALRGAGFTHVADFEDEDGPCRIMLRTR